MSQVITDGNSIKTKSLEGYDECVVQAHQAYIEQQENDIAYMANVFECEAGSWKSAEEMYAGQAQQKINMAKQRIRELQEEIEKQEKIVCAAERIIQNYRRHSQIEKATKRGRPARSAYREKIAEKFMSQWIASLKDALQAKSCVELEKMVSSISERNWRRWLKGDAIPTYSTFDKLLSTKIEHGKYAGEVLYKVPVTPSHNDLLTLLRFI